MIAILSFASTVDAATIKPVNVPPVYESLKNSTYGFQTPNGEVGYHGRDFVDRHTAGNRFNSTDTLPRNKTVPVTLKPTVIVPRAGVASKAIGLLKVSPQQLALSAGVGLMLDAIDGVIKDNQVMVPSVQEAPEEDGSFKWTVHSQVSSHAHLGQGPSPQTACMRSVAIETARPRDYPGVFTFVGVRSTDTPTNFICTLNYKRNGSTYQADSDYNVSRSGSFCPVGSTYDDTSGSCVLGVGYQPATESDFQTMEDLATNFDPEYLKDLLIASCDGSPSPGRCYDELASNGPLQGPASQTTPASTTSTTTTNPDGSTSTTSTSTQNNYTYTYSPTSYTYTTTTTTTTTAPNGETTTEVVTDAQPAGEEPSDYEEPDYTYANTDFPVVEPFYVQKYPDGFSGAWEARKAEIDNSEFMTFLQSFIPTFSGSCPSFELNLNIMKGANYGIQAFSSLCYVFDFIKAILLVTALFTSRALIFGG